MIHHGISPIIFNSIKHHLGYISHKINCCKNENDLKSLSKEILSIGHSPLDLYVGKIFPPDILKEITTQLQKKQKFSRYEFHQWIKKNNGYAQNSLSDQSLWTLRYLPAEETYIHIHPARKSKNAIRIHSILLKSTIIYAAWNNITFKNKIDPEEINFIRSEYFSLQPIKKIPENFIRIYDKIKKGQ
ncbi:MAG: hypothetical protein V1904_10705 [Bacteroidota bacterium]